MFVQHLERHPGEIGVRIETADLAVTLALRSGDARTADIAEALLADLPADTPQDQVHVLKHISATARAARRAIILARRSAHGTPAELLFDALSRPDRLARDIRTHLSRNEPLGLAMLDVAFARHPDSPDLCALLSQVSGRD